MVNSQRLQVLAFSDWMSDRLSSPEVIQEFPNIDLLLSCGDIPYHYIEKVNMNFGVPGFYVRGNHDSLEEFGVKGIKTQPSGVVNLDSKLINHNNILIAGFEGSVRYKEGPFMYTQLEMWLKVLNLVPVLLYNLLRYGRGLDILISHAPPWGIYPETDHVHQGFKAFNWLIKKFKPGYHFHGHIHIDRKKENGEFILAHTKIINTYAFVQTEVYTRKRHFSIGSPVYVSRSNLSNALEEFREARRKAAVELIMETLARKPSQLISFDEVVEHLKEKEGQPRGLQKIPLDAIVGSVGRNKDFTRKFLPKKDGNQARWVAIRRKFTSVESMKPIEVYQIGEVYFVLDGNHRVSVARQNGETAIQAYVTEIETQLPLSPEDDPQDIILKAQQLKFIEKTKLDQLRPTVDFSVTTPGQFRKLSELIAIHHYFLELEAKQAVPYEHAVTDWVDSVFLPSIRVIRSQGLLRDFPDRTPTDLFLWLIQEQQTLARELGWDIDVSYVAEDISHRRSKRAVIFIQRTTDKLLNKLRPKQLNPGPLAGQWRKSLKNIRNTEHLFRAILVAIPEAAGEWQAVQQAILFAKRENSVLRGIHILAKNEDKNGESVQALQTRFESLCNLNGVKNELIIQQGTVAELIRKYSKWNDLIILPLNHPPQNKPADRLKSGFRNLIHSSPRPLLAVPSASNLKHALLAFDNSPRAWEALYIAAYFVEHWDIKLSILIAGREESSAFIKELENYLSDRQLQPNILVVEGAPGELIMQTAEREACDFIMMGGYSYSPLLEVVLGSTVDEVLRSAKRPVFISK